MKISSKTYYGLKALSFLAQTQGLVSAREIAEKEDIPHEYLEKIFQSLRKGGFVQSHRGAGGGYELAHNAKDISLSDVFAELEGPFFDIPCFGTGCPKESTCSTKDVWHQVNTMIDTSLSQITLHDILSKKHII